MRSFRPGLRSGALLIEICCCQHSRGAAGRRHLQTRSAPSFCLANGLARPLPAHRSPWAREKLSRSRTRHRRQPRRRQRSARSAWKALRGSGALGTREREMECGTGAQACSRHPPTPRCRAGALGLPKPHGGGKTARGHLQRNRWNCNRRERSPQRAGPGVWGYRPDENQREMKTSAGPKLTIPRKAWNCLTCSVPAGSCSLLPFLLLLGAVQEHNPSLVLPFPGGEQPWSY